MPHYEGENQPEPPVDPPSDYYAKLDRLFFEPALQAAQKATEADSPSEEEEDDWDAEDDEEDVWDWDDDDWQDDEWDPQKEDKPCQE